jgi:hypothetical protein
MNDGGPAFARSETRVSREQRGMSLRDYFAGQIATAAFAGEVRDPLLSAAWCFRCADALVAARGNGKPQTTSAAPAEHIRLFLDGNQFCAVHPDFINLQESPAGFGDTPTEAVDALLKNSGRLVQ